MKKALIVVGTYLIIQAGMGIALIFVKSKDVAQATTVGIEPKWLLLMLAVSAVLSFIATILICRKGFKAPFKWRYPSKQTLEIFGISLLTMLPLMAFSNSLTELLGVPDNMTDTFGEMSNNAWALWVMAFLGPISEEICFRYGVAGSLLEEIPSSPNVAIIVSALLFGLIHMNPAQMVGATLLGLYFGWLYAKTRSVIPSLVCHVFNNFVAVLMLQTLSKDFCIAGLLPSSNYLYLVVAVSLVVALPLLVWLNKKL